MIADLISPNTNKPFVVSSGDDALVKAAEAVHATRHNNGAVFAFVDGHIQWITSTEVIPSLFLPSVPTNYMSTAMKLGALFDNIVHYSGSVYTSNVRVALASAGLTNAVGTALGNTYVHFYDTNGSISYQIGANGAGPGEISPIYYNYDPSTTMTPHIVPWWKIGAGGTTITGFNYQGFCCGWGTRSVYPITGLSNATAQSTTLVIKPTANATGTKKMALVAYNWNATAKVVATMNYIRLGSDTTTTYSGVTTTAATPGGSGPYVASAIGFAFPVKADENITIKYTAQASGGVTRGGAFLVFED
ncbi:MAG: H-X9-DG-CTERM domain-containing protein [Armatimonadota bacterium]